jgi:hypothetical protein
MPCTAVERRPRSATAAAGADAVVGIMMVNFSGCCYWIIRIFDDAKKSFESLLKNEGGDVP